VDVSTNAVFNFTISIPASAHPLDTKRNLTVARLLEYLTARNKDNIKIVFFNGVFTLLIH